MSAVFEKLNIEIYGESHAERIGVKIGGIVSNAKVSTQCVENMLVRRRAKNDAWSTPRKELDKVVFVSGLDRKENFVLDGNIIEAYIENKNIKPQDYSDIVTKPRPSHADYVSYMRRGSIPTGGGRFSGRMTAPLCIAGAIAEEVLKQNGIEICAYIAQIAEVDCGSYKHNTELSTIGLSKNNINSIKIAKLPLLNPNKTNEIEKILKNAAVDKDSVGGIIECVVMGVEVASIGDAIFDGLEGKIAASVYTVPAVKGVEFGEGFGLCCMRGSEANDAFEIVRGKVKTITNKSGGINGGIANGMPITLRVAIRPTPSIAKLQKTVDLCTMSNTEIEINGRHDACIVPRAVPCVESAVALAILDEILKYSSK